MIPRRQNVLATIRARIVLVLTIALLIPTAAAAQHFPANEDLEVMLRYLVEDGETPAIVLGVLEADGSTRILSYGEAGSGARPLGPRSVFEIGSINKTFTGTLLADMVACGDVALSDPIGKYLPDGVTAPSRGGREITLLDLATHHSGLPRLPDNHTPADRANPYADYTIEKLYTFLSNHELRRDPGAEAEYSNLGFGLLGHLLARASGKSYTDLVHERILKPLGMTMTGYELDGELGAWMTKGHARGDVVPYWFATESIQGAGGLRSNIEDMLTYLKANVGPAHTDLERAMRDARAVHKQLQGEMSIGLGWQVRSYQGRSLVQHGGGTGGFNTYISFDPDKRVGFVMLTNTTGFQDDIGQDFLRRGPPLDIPEVTVDRDILASYVGSYEVAPGRAMVVRMEGDGTLTMQAPSNVRFRMYAESDTKFFLKRTPWRFTFTKDDSGAVVGMIGDLEGTERRGRKVSDDGPPPAVVAGNATLDLPVTAADIARYEGTYTLEAGARTLDVRVFGEDGVLKAQPTGQNVTVLLRQGEHEFVAAADHGIRVVFTVTDGRAEGLALHQGGGVFPGRRKQE